MENIVERIKLSTGRIELSTEKEYKNGSCSGGEGICETFRYVNCLGSYVYEVSRAKAPIFGIEKIL